MYPRWSKYPTFEVSGLIGDDGSSISIAVLRSGIGSVHHRCQYAGCFDDGSSSNHSADPSVDAQVVSYTLPLTTIAIMIVGSHSKTLSRNHEEHANMMLSVAEGITTYNWQVSEIHRSPFWTPF